MDADVDADVEGGIIDIHDTASSLSFGKRDAQDAPLHTFTQEPDRSSMATSDDATSSRGSSISPVMDAGLNEILSWAADYQTMRIRDKSRDRRDTRAHYTTRDIPSDPRVDNESRGSKNGNNHRGRSDPLRRYRWDTSSGT